MLSLKAKARKVAFLDLTLVFFCSLNRRIHAPVIAFPKIKIKEHAVIDKGDRQERSLTQFVVQIKAMSDVHVQLLITGDPIFFTCSMIDDYLVRQHTPFPKTLYVIAISG